MPKETEQDEAGVWNFREVPRDAIVKAKIGAALEGLSVKAYMIQLVEAHWVEMEKNGLVPKGSDDELRCAVSQEHGDRSHCYSDSSHRSQDLVHKLSTRVTCGQ